VSVEMINQDQDSIKGFSIESSDQGVCKSGDQEPVSQHGSIKV